LFWHPRYFVLDTVEYCAQYCTYCFLYFRFHEPLFMEWNKRIWL